MVNREADATTSGLGRLIDLTCTAGRCSLLLTRSSDAQHTAGKNQHGTVKKTPAKYIPSASSIKPSTVFTHI